MFCNNPRPDSFSNNLDEQCKQIIKAINRSSIPINKPVPLPELPSLKLSELPSGNKDSDNSPLPKRFNSRKKTGKTPQELQKEAYEKEQEAYEKEQEAYEKALQQQHDRFLGYLDSRIEQVQAVEIKDSQLKSLQTKLIQAYQQEREAQAIFTPFPDLDFSPIPIEDEKMEEYFQQSEEQMNQQVQQMNEYFQQSEEQMNQQLQQMHDASSEVQTANSSLNKYCGLE